MRQGSVVRVIRDGSIGVVISQKNGYLYVLFEDYTVNTLIPIKEDLVAKTGKFFDLSIIWDTIKAK